MFPNLSYSNHTVDLDCKSMQKQSPRGVLKKGALKTFTKLTGKYLCQSFFLNKVAACNFDKIRDSGTDVFL